MCGIAGWVGASHDLGESLANDLQAAMQARGPDAHGAVCWGASGKVSSDFNAAADDVVGALVHTRLSILDLAEHATQPMSSSDGRYHLTYNGEIYNYLELREELEAKGISFKTSSDTEVLLQAYICWGREVLHKLTGMFAFVILDASTNELFAARDPFGIKPFFYSVKGGGFRFASDLNAMLCFPQTSRKLNARRAYEYLTLGVNDYGEKTFFRDVNQLPAAHWLKIDALSGEILEKEQYWRPSVSNYQDISFPEAVQELRKLFLESVSLHLRSDVSIGACLSGGVDSSAIVCAIRHLNPDANLHTFTYVADDANLSEERWADIAGEHTAAHMHKVSAGVGDLVEDLDELIRLQGEPFGSTSIYAQYKVFQLAKEAGITVMLDGQGADEIFAGYTGYQCARLAQLLRQGKFIQAWRFLRATTQWPGRSIKFMLAGAGSFFLSGTLRSKARHLMGKSLVPDWLSTTWLQKENIDVLQDPTKVEHHDYFRGALRHALEVTSLPSLLRYEDKDSMTHSIESRVPFLTREIVDFAYSLPASHLIDEAGRSKAVLREAMRGIMPDALIDRRDKIGFETPESTWLSALTPWVEETLATAGDVPLFHPDALMRSWQAVVDGKESFDFRVWRWLNFLRWARLYDVEFD